MPIGDYAVETDKEYKQIPDGTYTVKIDNAEGAETKNGHPCLKVRFRIQEGEFKNYCLFKDYVINEKTCEKFLPWQFSVMEIWDSVKMADNFILGLEKAIDAIKAPMDRGDQLEVVVMSKENTWEGKTTMRQDVTLNLNLGPRVAGFGQVEPQKVVKNYAPTLDTNEEMPF